MTRILWIAALASALVCFVAGSVYYAASWLAHGAMSMTGWFVLASSVLMLWVAARYLRFRIHEARHADAVSHAVVADSQPLHG